MTAKRASEGEIPFDIPEAGKPCVTWYKIVGDISSSKNMPLIVVHGGPGASHEYLLPLTDLYEKHDIPVIFYDQIGCGKSTRLREKNGDEAFWTVDLFVRELENLVDYLGLRSSGFDYLGHSWGGMLGGVYAARHPIGLRKLILADAPSSIPLMVKGEETLVEELPKEVKDVIEECHRKGDFESEAYQNACLTFYHRHMCRLDPWPEQVHSVLGHLEEDSTTYLTMYGPSELKPTGSLKDWEGWSEAHKINVETLLINGRYDEVQDIAVAPWFQAIPKVKWVQLENSSHMGHIEERDRFMQFIDTFLRSPNAEK